MLESTSLKKVYFISPVYPPHVCGVGDYTACLVQTLAKEVSVKVLTTVAQNPDFSTVLVEQAFSLKHPRSILKIVDALKVNPPDWLILQYDPFSYGMPYGINPYLPWMLFLLRKSFPQLRVGIIVHETFRPVNNFKSALLQFTLTIQLWIVCYFMDAIFIVVESWVTKVNQWFPSKVIQHLPVSSNISRVTISRNQMRKRLGISSQTIVLGLFGRMHAVRSYEHIILSAKKIIEAGQDILILYIGLHPSAARTHLNIFPLIAEGPLANYEISEYFTAMDIYLAPFNEGVSTRRTSFMAGLQHGLPTVSTYGVYTETLLMAANRKAYILTANDCPEDFAGEVLNLVFNPAYRQQLSINAEAFFQNEYSWPSIASKFLSTINHFPASS